MNSNPLVSIIMPAFNVEKYIKDSIESVLNQTYTNLELIIIDDKSTDNTKNIIQKYALEDKRIKPIYNEINSGKPSMAKNMALAEVNGEYIAFLDSDDSWLLKKLEKQINLISSKNYMLCYTGGYYIDNQNSIVGEFIPRYKNGNIFTNQLLRYEINNQSVVISKDVLKKFNEQITIGEDYNLFMNIAYKHSICSIKEKLIKYRIHDNSISRTKTHDLSAGTLYTLKELNNKYLISLKYPLSFTMCLLNAIRHKMNYLLGL